MKVEYIDKHNTLELTGKLFPQVVNETSKGNSKYIDLAIFLNDSKQRKSDNRRLRIEYIINSLITRIYRSIDFYKEHKSRWYKEIAYFKSLTDNKGVESIYVDDSEYFNKDSLVWNIIPDRVIDEDEKGKYVLPMHILLSIDEYKGEEKGFLNKVREYLLNIDDVTFAHVKQLHTISLPLKNVLTEPSKHDITILSEVHKYAFNDSNSDTPYELAIEMLLEEYCIEEVSDDDKKSLVKLYTENEIKWL